MFSFKKIEVKNGDVLIFFVILSIFLIILFLPVYDDVNGFHNIILDNYQLVWRDGRSPANLYLVKNIIQNNSISFPKDYFIGDKKVKNNYDFVQINESFVPKFNFYGSYVYAIILYLFPIYSDLQLFKEMIILNTILSISLLFVFYRIQKFLGLNTKYSLISTLVAGITTSVLIYSRYLFVEYTIINLIFITLIYFIIRRSSKESLKMQLVGLSLLSFLLIFLWNLTIILIFSIIFSYYFVKYKKIKKEFLLFIALVTILAISLPFTFFSETVPRDIPIGLKNKIVILGKPIFSVFSDYINALDYSAFGYHNVSSIRIFSRNFALIYAFEQQKGNAIFLSVYGLFGSLFGPKGIIYNSPYLIFSILGIFLFKEGEDKNMLLILIISIILIYGLFHSMWYGGVTPRYNRFFTVPAILLTFFSFYYLQKTKSILIKLVFLILIILSILNVASLAIRTDWNYEHESDLVSYDLVLWPWYTAEEKTQIGMKIYLTSTEIPYWDLSGDNGCRATLGGFGLITDPCWCTYDSWAERKTKLEKDVTTMEIVACADMAGDDGTQGSVYIDNKLIGEIFIDTNNCSSEKFAVNMSAGEHTIKFKSGLYGNCDAEMVYWKSIKFE